MRKIYLVPLLASQSVFGAPVVVSDSAENPEEEIAKYSEEELLQKVFGKNRKQKEVMMEFNVTLDGENVGQAFVIAGSNKGNRIFAKNLKDILSEYLVDDEAEKIDKLTDSNGFVLFSKLDFLGLKTDFNLTTLDVAITVPISKKKTRTLSGRKDEDNQKKVNTKPATISAILNNRISQTISSYGGSQNSTHTTNSTIWDISPSINVCGVVLETSGTFSKYSDDQKTKYHRDYISLVYDFPKRPIRFRAGDVFSTSQSYYSVPRLWGIGFRKEAIVSSANNCSSNLEITVLRESKIEVFVNNALVKTKEHVAPGTYYLDDIQYSYGENDVKIKLTDNTGKTEIIDASSFLDSSIVAPGEFSLDCNFGYPENNSTDKDRYDKKRKTISAGIRYGLPQATDVLIGGVKTRYGHTFTTELRNSNKLGFFTVRYGASKYSQRPKGKAFYLSYSSPSIKLVDSTTASFGTSYEKTDDFFYSYLDDVPNKRHRTNNLNDMEEYPEDDLLERRKNYNGKTTNNSYHVYLSNVFGINLSAGYNIRHKKEETEKKRSFSASKNFQLESDIFSSLGIYFSHDRTEYSGRKSSRCFSISCSLSFKDNGSLTSSYNKYEENSTSYISYSNDCLDRSVYYHLQNFRHDGKNDISGDITYYHPRFKADASHSYSSHSSRTTRLGIESNLYFADGHFGISKNSVYDGGFVIINSGGDIANMPIKMESGEKSGILGGAVVSSYHHSVNSNKIDIKEMPDNIEIKEDSVVSYGEYKRGAVKEIKVDGTYLAQGILLDRNGKPFGLSSGYATYIGDKNIEPVVFFTNANGKFILSNLKLGKYRVSVNVEGCKDFEINITRCKDNIVNLGTVVCEGTYEDI